MGAEVRRIHTTRFLRFGGPKSPEACLTTSEIAAVREIVEAHAAGRDTDAYLRAPGFTLLARAYLHLLGEHTGLQRAISRLLAGPEVH